MAKSASLIGEKAEKTMENFETYSKGIDDIFAKHNLTPDMISSMS